MATYKCLTHNVTVVVNGNVRNVRYSKSVPNLPSGCTLLLLKTPRAMSPGALYTSPATGRSAYNPCEIIEEATT